MLPILTLFLMQSGVLSLRMTTSAGSFPRPLKAAEEQELLQRSAEGDQEARNKLI